MLYEDVKRYLLSLQPGDRLESEVELCGRFDASRGMIREVISHLVHLGLLERTARRGTFVKAPSIEDISENLGLQLQVAGLGFEELKEMRLLLERSQVPLLIKRATPMALDRLSGLLDEMAAAEEDADRAEDLDRRFHLALVEICGNRILKVFSQVINMTFDRRYREKFRNAKAVRKSVRDHRAMLTCLKAGDEEGLKQVITDHIRPL